jgi:hypothetical protein
MAQFVYSIVSHPLYFLGFILSFAAGFAFLIFLRGFFSGVGHLFTIDHHDEHLLHSRLRAVWGVVLLLDIFMIWVVIRTIASFFGGPAINVSLTETIFGLYIFWQIIAWFILPAAPKGGGH